MFVCNSDEVMDIKDLEKEMAMTGGVVKTVSSVHKITTLLASHSCTTMLHELTGTLANKFACMINRYATTSLAHAMLLLMHGSWLRNVAAPWVGTSYKLTCLLAISVGGWVVERSFSWRVRWRHFGLAMLPHTRAC